MKKPAHRSVYEMFAGIRAARSGASVYRRAGASAAQAELVVDKIASRGEDALRQVREAINRRLAAADRRQAADETTAPEGKPDVVRPQRPVAAVADRPVPGGEAGPAGPGADAAPGPAAGA